MELGDFFGGIMDVGTAYLQSKIAPPTYGGGFAPISTPGWGVPPFGAIAPTLVAPTAAVAAAGPGIPPAMDPRVCGPSPVWKKVCGVYKWVYPKRRRRRQLITQSDAAGLAKLKGIVGQGKVMEVWIATHGGR